MPSPPVDSERRRCGDVETRADLDATRQALLAAKRERTTAVVGDFAERIERLGGEVTYRCRLGRCLNADLTAEQVDMLVAFEPAVAWLDLVGPLSDAAPEPHPFDGVLINETYQTGQFWDFDWQDQGVSAHYDGDNGQSTDVTFAILERGGFRTTHKSYHESSGTWTLPGTTSPAGPASTTTRRSSCRSPAAPCCRATSKSHER